MLDVRVATTESEREEIFRFRYLIYVEQMKRHQAYADHARRRIEEPLDESGHILGAWSGRILKGTVRVNIAADGDLGLYQTLYRLKESGLHGSRTSITTKLMVTNGNRGSFLACSLAKASYQMARQKGVEFDFIDCNEPLVPFFERLGYRRCYPDIHHPEYGQVVPMVLALMDAEHLRWSRSPFAELLDRYPIAGAPDLTAIGHLTELALPDSHIRRKETVHVQTRVSEVAVGAD